MEENSGESSKRQSSPDTSDGKRIKTEVGNSSNGGPLIVAEGPSKSRCSVEFMGSAFYNPAQEFNRDLSVCVAKYFCEQRKSKAEELKKDIERLENEGKSVEGKKKQLLYISEKLKILEALAATGLRAIRYAKEIEGLGTVLANDFSSDAVEVMRHNVDRNSVADIVTPNFQDAIVTMHEHKRCDKRFHVVDLDPYGSPSQFLDAAVQCVDENGILMVTCTDVAVLCGNSPETCFSKYGSMSVKSKSSHEMALRILLRSIESHANRYARYIEPLMSVSIDFYIRVFVRMKTGQAKVKDSVCKLSHMLHCPTCENMVFQPVAKKSEAGKGQKYLPAPAPVCDKACAICGSGMQIGGPFWTERIHDFEFVKNFIEFLKTFKDDEKPGTYSRVLGLVSVISEEIPEALMFYDYTQLCRVVKCSTPKLNVFRSAILNAGYRVSISHTDPKGIKTDAPPDVFWDIVVSLAKKNGITHEKFDESHPGRRVMQRVPKIEANFTLHPEAEPKTRMEGLLRFQDNKGKNWGPQRKARGSIHSVMACTYSDNEKEAKGS